MRAALPGNGFPPVAAVCVWPKFVRVSRRLLAGSGVKVATVAGGFPDGRATLERRVAEIKQSIDAGTDEIDTVLSATSLGPGGEAMAFDEISASREACGPGVVLKVILETGALVSPDSIRRAASIAMSAGADFIKSSTGKITGGATIPAARTMMQAVQDFSKTDERPVGIKISGGIRKTDQAIEYVDLLRTELGPDWATPDRFRLGASVLLDELTS
jgi:deoxyribose-phosphate aldolase